MSAASGFDLRDFIDRDHLGALVGARFVSLSDTECRYAYEATERHHNPGGTLHGGALFTVMDSSQGMLVFSQLHGAGQIAATGTATIKYLAPVRAGAISIRSVIERREGRKLFVHTEALDAQGTKVAVLDEIWISLPPRAA